MVSNAPNLWMSAVFTSNNPRAENMAYCAHHHQKLMRSGESHNEYIYRILRQSNDWFVQKHGNITWWLTDRLRESTSHRPWLMDSPHKGPVLWNFGFCLLLACTSCCTNNGVASELRCHDAHVTSWLCNINSIRIMFCADLLSSSGVFCIKWPSSIHWPIVPFP